MSWSNTITILHVFHSCQGIASTYTILVFIISGHRSPPLINTIWILSLMINKIWILSLMDFWKILNDKFVSLLIRIMTTDVLFLLSWLISTKVPPGNYSPSCTVNGSIPLADVTIMMGDTQMPGILGKDNNEGSTYVANETEFRGCRKIYLYTMIQLYWKSLLSHVSGRAIYKSVKAC